MPISSPDPEDLGARLVELERRNRLLTEGLQQADRLRGLWRKALTELQETKQRLQASEERFSLAMRGARDGLWDRDLVAGTHFFSPQTCLMLGLPADACGQSWAWWMARVHPEDAAAFRQAQEQTRAEDDGRFEVTVRIRGREDRYHWVLCRGITLRGEDGTPRRVIGVMADMSDWVRVTQELQFGTQVIASTHEGVMVTDAAGTILSVNPAFTRLTGYEAADAVGRNAALLQSGRHGRRFYQGMWSALKRTGHWHGEVWNRNKAGGVFAEELNISAIRDPNGQVSHYVGVFSDVTERIQEAARMRRLAFHDPLTALPNRNLFVDRVRQAVRQARRSRQMIAALFMDLDRFKEVNDQWGHEVGDELLVAVARRLRDALRDEDTVARLGGDEFTAVLRSVQSRDDVQVVATRIVHALARPFKLGGRVDGIGVSVGCAIFPEHGKDADALLRCADEAMYAAKHAGRGRVVVYGDALPDEAP